MNDKLFLRAVFIGIMTGGGILIFTGWMLVNIPLFTDNIILFVLLILIPYAIIAEFMPQLRKLIGKHGVTK